MTGKPAGPLFVHPAHLAGIWESLDAVAHFNGVPIVVEALVPLTKIDPDTGDEVEVAYWKIGGRIVMHPDRFAAFERGIRRLDDMQATAREGLEAIIEATAKDPGEGEP